MRRPVQYAAVVAIAVAAMALAAHDPAPAETVAVPADFKLRLTSAARKPAGGPPDIHWVEITRSGETRLSAKRAGGNSLPATTIKLSPAAVAQIYQAVVKQRFFELRPEYRDPNVRGGDQVQMTVTANGKKHTVAAVNIRVNALDAITLAVNAVLPPDRIVSYNALHVKSYRAVER